MIGDDRQHLDCRARQPARLRLSPRHQPGQMPAVRKVIYRDANQIDARRGVSACSCSSAALSRTHQASAWQRRWVERARWRRKNASKANSRPICGSPQHAPRIGFRFFARLARPFPFFHLSPAIRRYRSVLVAAEALIQRRERSSVQFHLAFPATPGGASWRQKRTFARIINVVHQYCEALSLLPMRRSSDARASVIGPPLRCTDASTRCLALRGIGEQGRNGSP